MTRPDPETRIAELEAENRALRREIRVAHEAAEITAHKVIEQFGHTDEALQRLRATSGQLKAVLDAATEVSVVACDRDGTIRLFSRGAERLLGYRADEAVGRLSVLALHRDVELAEAGRALTGEAPPRGAVMKVFEWHVVHGVTGLHEWTYVRRDGSTFPVNLAITALPDSEGEPGGYLSVAMDLSWRKALEARLEHQANHDPLTGLLNRRSFEEALEREAARTDRYSTPFALLMFDIDHFKAVNDTYGHFVGDDILLAVSRMVSQRLRGPDTLARWGGEEFIALLPETSLEGARAVAEDLRATVPGTRFSRPGSVTITAGVAAHQAGEPAHALTKRVDDALYAGKEHGRDRVVTA